MGRYNPILYVPFTYHIQPFTTSWFYHIVQTTVWLYSTWHHLMYIDFNLIFQWFQKIWKIFLFFFDFFLAMYVAFIYTWITSSETRRCFRWYSLPPNHNIATYVVCFRWRKENTGDVIRYLYQVKIEAMWCKLEYITTYKMFNSIL